MTLYSWGETALLFVLLAIFTPLLGAYMAKVFQGQSTLLSPIFSPIERACYKISDIDPEVEMSSGEYVRAFIFFNFLGFLFLLAILLLQGVLPLNPHNFPGLSWHLALNTAISFATNTNWQSYAGESTLSYLSQMLGLAVQNFLSAAAGFAVLLALMRGLIRKNSETLGNFWVDVTRGIVYILLPLSFVYAIFLVSQGVIQNFLPYAVVQTLDGGTQTLPMGPVASQEAIKLLGTNGGGFFNANSAHPFENPDALTNFFELFSILLIPAGLTFSYGRMISSQLHGWLLFCVMVFFLAIGLMVSLYAEHAMNATLEMSPNLEGKEMRIGTLQSLIWTVFTTSTANGSINTMISSLAPLTGGVAMFNMMHGELIFGGIGVGLCSMIMYVLLTVFLSGLMVGRTPEYLGKKIERHEMFWVSIAILFPGILILIGTAISCALPLITQSLGNNGPHGFSELLYAFSSAASNNGSAFAGLNANVPYFNVILGFTMLLARIALTVSSILLAGLLARKKIAPVTSGTFSTNTQLFAILLIGVILIFGALTFFPALSFGPIVDHLLMLEGRYF